jgi:hypothetical protein
MSVEDMIRSGLQDLAEQMPPIADLPATTLRQGRRRRRARRAATAGGAILSVAAITGVGLVAADNIGSGRSLQPAAHGDATQHVVANPWWQTWTMDRYNGGITPAFLHAARPTYDVAKGPERIKVYAAGTLPDGVQWAMFTDETSPHVLQWLQGTDNHPNFGESPGAARPEMTWTSRALGTQVWEHDPSHPEGWLIVVGRPGTTSIEYSPDGVTWRSLEVENGIGLMKVKTSTGFPPATAKVRLTDASGVYATGTPEGAGIDPDPQAHPTPGEATVPTATPTQVKPGGSVAR